MPLFIILIRIVGGGHKIECAFYCVTEWTVDPTGISSFQVWAVRIENPARCDRSPPEPAAREAAARDRCRCRADASTRDTDRPGRGRGCSTCPDRGREIEAWRPARRHVGIRALCLILLHTRCSRGSGSVKIKFKERFPFGTSFSVNFLYTYLEEDVS